LYLLKNYISAMKFLWHTQILCLLDISSDWYTCDFTFFVSICTWVWYWKLTWGKKKKIFIGKINLLYWMWGRNIMPELIFLGKWINEWRRTDRLSSANSVYKVNWVWRLICKELLYFFSNNYMNFWRSFVFVSLTCGEAWGYGHQIYIPLRNFF